MINDLVSVSVSPTDTISSAMAKIEANKFGFVLAVENDGSVVGCVTDGDIRRLLLSNGNLNSRVHDCMETQFEFVHNDALDSEILKKLDLFPQCLPVLDQNKKLSKVITKDSFRPQKKFHIVSRCKAPARISFGGGGSDLTKFFKGQSGAVLNASIGLFATSSVKLRADKSVRISSSGLNRVCEGDSLLDALRSSSDFGLIGNVIELINPEFGFELSVDTDFPIGSGLGGSSAMTNSIMVALMNCEATVYQKGYCRTVVLRRRHMSNISGGWQGQYASAIGGLNFMEFSMESTKIMGLRLEPHISQELECSLHICFTGIHEIQVK